MKNETKRSYVVSESRKIRKPLIEKKRRARINDSLETLKQILLESKASLKKSTGTGNRAAKLEKADILEMTVAYLQTLRKRLMNVSNQQQRNDDDCRLIKSAADSTCDRQIKYVTVIPAKLADGNLANVSLATYILPQTATSSNPIDGAEDDDSSVRNSDKDVWRPW